MMNCPLFLLPEVLEAVFSVSWTWILILPYLECIPSYSHHQNNHCLSLKSHQALSLGGFPAPVLSLSHVLYRLSYYALAVSPPFSDCSVPNGGWTHSISRALSDSWLPLLNNQCHSYTSAKGLISSSQEKSGETS